MARTLTPQDYGLPASHKEWRPEQREIIDWLLGAEMEGANKLWTPEAESALLEAPVGCGKTSYATSLSKNHRAISLCRTKSLQAENYGNMYRWNVLFGKGNYPCVHPGRPRYDSTAEECIHSDNMKQCAYLSRCGYHQAKMKAIESNKASLNYSYYMTSRWPRDIGAEYLVLDEAHQLSDITLDHVGTTLTGFHMHKWQLPGFPELDNSGESMFSGTHDPIEQAINWLDECVEIVNESAGEPGAGASKEEVVFAQDSKHLASKLEATIAAMVAGPHDWYIVSGTQAKKGREGYEPGFVAKPLTARHHFGSYFLLKGTRVLMMSGTIGDPEAFAAELGVKSYGFYAVPNAWPAEVRPVLVLDAPKMGYNAAKKDPTIYDKQADVIANAIKGVNRNWSGIIHVSKKTEAGLLAQRLAQRGLGDRLWVPEVGTGTNKQLEDWRYRKMKVPNSLAVVWTWSEGVDLRDDQICVISKINFLPRDDPYEMARERYDGKFAKQRVAWTVAQQLGRTRRGEAEDYDLNGKQVQLVAIADGNYAMIKSYLPQDVKEALVKA